MIVNAILRQGSVFRTMPLTQYDEGQKIHLSGVELPASYLAEFANSESGTAEQITQTTDTVTVPDKYLTSGNPVYVWIVVVGQDERTTRYQIIVPVKGRGEPDDYTPTPSEQTAIEAAITALNSAVDAAGAAIEHYPRIVGGIWQVWDVTNGAWVSTGVGATGNGIAGATLNEDYTLTLTFTDGTSYTAPSIRGAQGPKGDKGDPGEVTQAEFDDLKSAIDELVLRKPIQQSDLVFSNSNFVVSNGKAYAVSVVSPYNCMAINAKRIDFKYRRRSSNYSFYVGVAIDGKFVGNRTNAVVSEIKTLYDTTNTTYTDATVNKSVADDDYSNDYNDYTATLTGQVFELKKGETTILKFTVASNKTIQGIAILNYRFDYYATTDNTDFKDGKIVSIPLEEEISRVEIKADHADIIGLQSNHRLVAGVIRNAGTGWEFIVNDRHQGDMNCLSVGIDGTDGRLYVDYSGINAKKVISLIAAPDEAFANAGYVMGASVGLDKAYIQIYQYALQSASAQIRANSDGTFTVESADGVTSAELNSTNNTLDITHDSLTNKVPSTAANVSILPCFYGKMLPRIYSISATKTRIEFIDTATATKATTPGTGMSVNFSRYGSALVRNEIDPSTLVSANGNIWFIGIFEV